MKDEQFKQVYAFVNLGITVIWAGFCVWITYQAVVSKLTVDILVSAGANALLGALIAWNGNIVQFFFRKAKPNGDPN
jgi:hypothetical protein